VVGQIPMTRADQVWVASTGERWYPAAMIAAMLGVPQAEVQQLVRAGYLPPGQPRAGGSRLYWPEYVVAKLQREAREGGGWAPYR
jgi:hypothetical protein